MKPNIFVHIPYRDLLPNLDKVLKEKLNIEIYLSAQVLDQIGASEFHQLSKTLKGEGLSCTIHGPFLDMSSGAIDKKVREVTLSRYLQVIETCHIFNPKVLVLHHGYDRWRYESHKEEWLKNNIQTFQLVIEASEGLDTVIAVENIFEEGPQLILQTLQGVNHPRLKTCFDTGHFLMFSKVPLEEWMTVLGRHLGQLHLHDNHGKDDDHLAIGQGIFPWERFFPLLVKADSQPTWVIEAHSEEHIRLSLAYLQKLLASG
jgi:sugar phosphate isomerase/epimerase